MVLVVADQVNHDWVGHAFLGDILDESGHRRRENHGTHLIVGNEVLDGHDVFLKAHVEHAVALVEDEKLYAGNV